MFLIRLKIGVVTVLSCLALLLGLLAPTGVASAHSTSQALSSQSSTSTHASVSCKVYRYDTDPVPVEICI